MPSPLENALAPEPTLGARQDAISAAVLKALGQSERLSLAREVAAVLGGSWRARRIADGPAWASDITDDHTPFEISLSFSPSDVVLRLLTEPQDCGRPSLLASWECAQRMHAELERRWSANLAPLEQVAEMFRPRPDSNAGFCIWHSAVLNANQPSFKVYLNPAIHGSARARELLASANAALGLSAGWAALSARALVRPGEDRLAYFSVDLADGPDARAKVYVAYDNSTALDVARVLHRCAGYNEASTRDCIRRVMGHEGPFRERPPIVCFAYSVRQRSAYSATLHLPVRCYVSDDLEVARSVCKLLSFEQRVRYLRLLTAISDRPLDANRGLQSYVSLRASPSRQAVTTYLTPQAYTADEPLNDGWDQAPSWPLLAGGAALNSARAARREPGPHA
jgi:DMATS type aromatic prenyltransferase